MDYAAAVNAELRDLKAAGADVIQLDEPWLHARPEEARRLAPAGDRPGPRRHPRADRAAPLLRLCLCRPRQAERLFVPARAHGLEGRADLDRSRPAQSRSHNPRRPRRQDRDQHGRPRAGDAADRRRPHPRGTRAPAPRAADPRPGLQHEIHPARPRLRQIEGARRRCRDRPSRADRRLGGRCCQYQTDEDVVVSRPVVLRHRLNSYKEILTPQMSQDILVSAMITSKITSKAQTTTTPQPVRAALRVARATSSLIGSRVTT